MAKPMKMPNGYGSVIKLSGRRRNPFAVRLTEGKSKKEDGKYHQTYKYLAYFEKRADALAYLADYNRGLPVPEHKSLINAPTFKEVYDEWLEFKTSRKKNPSQSTVRNYNTAVKHFENLWDKPLSR